MEVRIWNDRTGDRGERFGEEVGADLGRVRSRGGSSGALGELCCRI